MSSTELFRRARDFLVEHREDYETAYREFRWPVLDRFNWALDWFDLLADGNERTALHLVEEDGREVRLSYAQLAERSNRAATYFRRRGVERGHRLLMMLPNWIGLREDAGRSRNVRSGRLALASALRLSQFRSRPNQGSCTGRA